MRAVDFVFRTSSGISRSLLSNEDHPNDNLNKTYYRDQISKTVHTVKEIIHGMKTEPVPKAKGKDHPKESFKEIRDDEKGIDLEKPAKGKIRKILYAVFAVVMVVIASILLYPKLFSRNTLEKLRSSGERISVAVMPFQNMTNDETKNNWQDWIQDILITSLTNSEELNVRQSQTINYYIQSKGLINYASITPSVASSISQKLDASIFIYGSIIKERDKIRINAQLIDSKTEENYKSFQIDGTADKIIPTIDSLSMMVKDFLIISKFKKELNTESQRLISTNSPEAFKYSMDGFNAFLKRDYSKAINLFSQAIAADSNYFYVALMRAQAYNNQGLYDQARELFLKIYKKRDQMPDYYKIMADLKHAYWFETPFEVIKYAKQLLEYDDQSPNNHYTIADIYYWLAQYDKAIPEFEKTLEIFNKWGSKPSWSAYQRALGYCYHKTGQYKKEKKLYKKAEKDFPDDIGIISRQAILALTEGNTKDAIEYIEKYISIRKESSWSEAAITS